MTACPAGAQSSAHWLIIVDDLHLDFANTGQLRTLVKSVAAELMRDGDEIAIYSTGPSSVSVPWTHDRRVVDGVVKNIAGNSLKTSDILAIRGGFALTTEVDLRATVALSRLNAIVRGLDPALDRRICIIYISNGYVDRSLSSMRTHSHRRLPIFALDPRLLPGAIVDRTGVDAAGWDAYWAATRNSLRTLSEQSGGFALAEGDDLMATLGLLSDLVRQ